MSKWTKGLGIAGGICIGVGIIILGAGVILGRGSVDMLDAMSVRGSDFSGIIDLFSNKDDRYWYDDIEDLDSSRWNCTAVSDVKELNVDMAAGYLEIKRYAGNDVKVYILNSDRRTKISQDGKELEIQQDEAVIEPIKILIPQDTVFDSVDLEVQAGECEVDGFSAKELEVSVGTGEMLISGAVYIKESQWNVKAGELVVDQLTSQESDFECGAGSMEVTMTGKQDDYYLNGKVSAGSLEFGDNIWEGLFEHFDYGSDSALNHVKAECAAGEIVIDFTDTEHHYEDHHYEEHHNT